MFMLEEVNRKTFFLLLSGEKFFAAKENKSQLGRCI
jgi:hypothetical protein